VARSANGSTAVASSTANANFPASRRHQRRAQRQRLGQGGGWNDGTRNVFPDNIQVNFAIAQTINQINVFTLKNTPNNGSVVDDTTSATSYGIKNFDVQYWTALRG
jgi:hypothetical protein